MVLLLYLILGPKRRGPSILDCHRTLQEGRRRGKKELGYFEPLPFVRHVVSVMMINTYAACHKTPLSEGRNADLELRNSRIRMLFYINPEPINFPWPHCLNEW